MNRSKKYALIGIAVLITFVSLFSGCIPREERMKGRHYRQGNELLDTITQKLKDGTLKDSLSPDINSALAERIRTGKVSDFLPHPSIMVVGAMIPTVCIAAFLIFLIFFLKLYHTRTMTLIEKGKYEQKPLKIRWELLVLFSGLTLVFLGLAISIYMISLYGFHSWTITGGIIPVFIGAAFLVFYRMYKNIR